MLGQGPHPENPTITVTPSVLRPEILLQLLVVLSIGVSQQPASQRCLYAVLLEQGR